MYRCATAISIPLFVLCCSEPPPDAISEEIRVWESSPLGKLPQRRDRPTISHVRIVDLDQDGLLDILVCDVLGQKVSWIQQDPLGVFTEHDILVQLNGPVHIEAVFQGVRTPKLVFLRK